MPPASDILSPFASPFYPCNIEHDGAFSYLYYDGIPTGLVNEHEVITNIPDEAIDELFPPTAVDAAELDATDDFLTMLAIFSLIEEKEEKSRLNIGFVASKRWEAKRKEGLRGRPHICTSERSNHHTMKNNLNINERRLISHTRHRQGSLDRSYLHDSLRHHRCHDEKRNFIPRFDKCIQQPRKKN